MSIALEGKSIASTLIGDSRNKYLRLFKKCNIFSSLNSCSTWLNVCEGVTPTEHISLLTLSISSLINSERVIRSEACRFLL